MSPPRDRVTELLATIRATHAAGKTARASSARFLAALAPWLTRLEPALRAALVTFALDPDDADPVTLARRVAISRRSLDRKVAEAGLSSTSRYMRAASLAAIWEVLSAHERSIAAIAQECGYRRMKTFQQHSRRIFGCPPGQVSRKLSAEEFAERLARHAVRPV
jgi:AraC-like DNA-binding protein